MEPSSPTWIQYLSVALVLITKTVGTVSSFNESSVLLSMVAPLPETLGVANGVAQTGPAARFGTPRHGIVHPPGFTNGLRCIRMVVSGVHGRCWSSTGTVRFRQP